MPFTPSPFGGNGDKVRTIYPFVVIPALVILLTVGALAFYLKSKAAPADTLVQLTRSHSSGYACPAHKKSIAGRDARQYDLVL